MMCFFYSNGLIEQWSSFSNSATSVIFPISFTTTPTVAITCYGNSDQAITVFSWGKIFSPTGFTCNANGLLTGRFYYAIGY